MAFRTDFVTQSRHIAPRVSRAGSGFNRIYPGLLAGLGFAAFFLVSAPALAQVAPDLGSTDTFGIVSETWSESDTPTGTDITGDVCFTTAPAALGSITISGTTETPCDDVKGTDQGNALADLNAQSCTSLGGGAVELNAESIGGGPPGVFPPGCYSSGGAMNITTGTTVTLSGAGVYIFRPGGAFNQAADSNVVAAGGACENDVFWTPTGATTIGANANIVGNIFRGTADGLSITFGDSSSLVGRALAFGSTVTTANNAIAVPEACPAPATITVNKDFSDDNPDPVSVDLTCDSGTVEETPLDASEAEPAVFTVTGADPGATCTATEEVPVGYTADETDCVDVELDGSCTIINTLIAPPPPPAPPPPAPTARRRRHTRAFRVGNDHACRVPGYLQLRSNAQAAKVRVSCGKSGGRASAPFCSCSPRAFDIQLAISAATGRTALCVRIGSSSVPH